LRRTWMSSETRTKRTDFYIHLMKIKNLVPQYNTFY
jgi:hypothetical protein